MPIDPDSRRTVEWRGRCSCRPHGGAQPSPRRSGTGRFPTGHHQGQYRSGSGHGLARGTLHVHDANPVTGVLAGREAIGLGAWSMWAMLARRSSNFFLRRQRRPRQLQRGLPARQPAWSQSVLWNTDAGRYRAWCHEYRRWRRRDAHPVDAGGEDRGGDRWRVRCLPGSDAVAGMVNVLDNKLEGPEVSGRL